MNLWRRAFGCSIFRRLTLEQFDRKLEADETAFLDEHRETCTPCYRYELHGLNAMNLLRGGVIEHDAPEGFTTEVLRAFRLTPSTSPKQLWGPVIAGAATAGLVLLAALQIITQSTKGLPDAGRSNVKAQFVVNRDINDTAPELIVRSDERL